MKMGLDDKGDATECQKILRSVAVEENNLSFTEQKAVEKAVNWVGGDRNDCLSLIEWMIVCRVVGTDIAIRLETEEKYYYLMFDVERSRNVIVDPEEKDRKVPVEEIEIEDKFNKKQVEVVKSSQVIKKKYEAVTAIAHEEHETKLVLGRYSGAVTVTTNGETKEYESKTTFSLPEPMGVHEAINWVQTEESADVEEIVTVNHTRNWDF